MIHSDHQGGQAHAYLGAWLMRGWLLYFGNLCVLNSSMDKIPGQVSSFGVPVGGGGKGQG